MVACLTKVAGSFLWVDNVERLAWQELHNQKSAGDLGVSCVATRGQALLSKKLCHQMAVAGTHGQNLAFWLGSILRDICPMLGNGGSWQPSPLLLAGRSSPSPPWITSASTMYAASKSPPPPSKVEAGWLFAWERVRRRQWDPCLSHSNGRYLLCSNPHHLHSSWTSGQLWDGGQWGLWRVER